MKKKSSFPPFAIGIDLVYIKRFIQYKRKEDRGFLKKIFSSREIQYCFSKQNPSQHLAVRFAAKEAIIKALSSNGQIHLALNEIEILSSSGKSPKVYLPHPISNIFIALSLAHEKDYAIATALLYKSELS